MNPESFWSKVNWEKIVFLALTSLFLLNLFILDVWLVDQRKETSVFPQTNGTLQEEAVASTPQPAETNACPQLCLEAIAEATSEGLTPISPVPTLAPSGIKTAAKEFFIGLGSGSTRAVDWEDMLGLEACIDKTKYSNIKAVVFEVGMDIPNGNQRANARLYNVTDGHPVWNSEVWLEGGTPKLLTSGSITLSPGKKLYRVQMKTQIGDLAVLSQARVKITTE